MSEPDSPEATARPRIEISVEPERRALAPLSDAARAAGGGDRFVIGRGDGSDLVLDHPTVSRRHAIVELRPGAATIEDAGSAAGLRVNGERARRTALTVGDQVAIGPYRMVYDGTGLIERRTGTGLALAAHGVAAKAGGTTILHPVDLHVRPGELVAVIGESGAGKSTLLKMLAGVTRPSAGHVLIGGEDVSRRLSELGYVPQFDTVHDLLTVTEALTFASRLRLPPDSSPHERDERIRGIVEQLGLSERAATRVGVLSGGQRKRVSVGMELLHGPGALFLDEPTTGLDPGLERRMMQLFRRLADGGQTVLLVTHATASLTLCDRVVVMGRGGHLRFDGGPDELLAAFGAGTLEEVYVALADGDERAGRAVAPSQRADGGRHQRRPLPPLSSGAARRPIKQPLGYQTRVLAERYATLMLRDRRHLRSALLQVPILGLLTALLFDGDVFARALPGVAQTAGAAGLPSAGKAAQLLFLMVTIAIWLGAIDAAREIVKERNVVTRELAFGVQVPAYLASKLVVLFTLAAVQTFAFALIVLLLRPLHAPGGGAATLIAVLIISSWVAVLAGLAVSAVAASEDQATGVIPLLLVPQLLFGGALVPLAEMSGVMQAVAALVPARWSFAAAGHAIDLRERIGEDRAFAATNRFGDGFFALPFPAFAAICVVFAAAFAAVVVLRLRRERTEL